jgi:hypothetical protein
VFTQGVVLVGTAPGQPLNMATAPCANRRPSAACPREGRHYVERRAPPRLFPWVSTALVNYPQCARQLEPYRPTMRDPIGHECACRRAPMAHSPLRGPKLKQTARALTVAVACSNHPGPFGTSTIDLSRQIQGHDLLRTQCPNLPAGVTYASSSGLVGLDCRAPARENYLHALKGTPSARRAVRPTSGSEGALITRRSV